MRISVFNHVNLYERDVFNLRGGSFLSPDTRSECFLRGVKFLAENLRGMKISWEIIRGMKISREIIRGMKIFPFQEK